MAKKNSNPAPEQMLSEAIESTGVAEVVRASSDAKSVKALHRVRQKRVWLAILEYVLSRANGWSAHVCQQYFIRGGRLVYGWNFILQPAGDLVATTQAVAKLIVQAGQVVPKVIASGPIDSFPLMGASPRRTAKIAFDPRLPGPDKGGPSHKGAYMIRSGE